MPDPEGNITAGDANVATPGPTPVAPDIGTTPPIVPGAAPDIGSRTASSLAVPPRPQPSFFRQLLFSLGKGLIEGTKAGLQAPLGPQGPAVAARTAIEAPQREREQLTTNQMNDLNIAMSQLKLHQLHMITNQMEDDQQNAVYNRGRDTLRDFVEKGKADILASGDLKAVQDELARRQKDATDGNQGLLPNMILPTERGPNGEPQYALVSVGKERLNDDIDYTWGAKDLGISEKEFKDAGLTERKFHASTGQDSQKAFGALSMAFTNFQVQATNKLADFRKTQVKETGAMDRAKLAAFTKLQGINMNNLNRFAIAQMKLAQDAGDKTKIAALGKLITAGKNVEATKGKFVNRAFSTLTGSETQDVQTAVKQLEQAQKEYDEVSKGAKPNITLTGKVPKGTVATPDVMRQYLQKAGGNKDVARTNLTNDGYKIPPRSQQTQ